MKKTITNNLMTILLIGAMLLYMLYSKGIIFADFHFLSAQESFQTIQNEENNVTILDVRNTPEYKSLGYIEGAILVPLAQLENNIEALQKFKHTKILVYCASGNRSISASRTLHAHGFHTYNINGGINAWKNNRYPISKYKEKR